MSTDLAISLSAQLALQRRLETIAHNVANLNTAGFRATGVKFETLLARAETESVGFATAGEDYISRKAGAATQTGNPLDVAISGEAWFAIETPGGIAYTRDGRFHLNDAGDLVSVKGYPVLDAGGGAITIDPTAGPVEIGEDGSISQAGIRIGGIGLFLIPEDAALTRHDNAAVFSSLPAAPAEDLTVNSVRQGYVEGANVDPVLEISRLIEVSRSFDYAVALADNTDQLDREAIRTLAPG
jgi:flagellar basal-body rod protein FlgF